MGSAPLPAAFLLTSLSSVILLEAVVAGVAGRLEIPQLWLIAVTRTLQIAVLGGLARTWPGGLTAIGLGRNTLKTGLRQGLIGSATFALAAGLLFAGLTAAGQDPFRLVRSPLPADPPMRVLFFIVGGGIAPVAEEIVFRGLIFGYLRRWGTVAAVLISTAVFAAFHTGTTVPVTQIVGGIVFAVAYHVSGSLLSPIVIHVLGNLAIFSLSLPFFY
ncbi:hypothetical protein DSCO28_10780 [Desulfosarcina ovata subsp. sediminis]|uniref:CAAX prenyl protease 2/Lysostaphin resistance protein A-like domain-containing protein n=1 Tax=Desulfosarcina ovata subsp. sediminis TaxID=885957 RepID=A0A5K7ZEM8_9BACT|nr:CPBP family intramembrane glutamic endopeptidase [Desulfosarcina ovata]BBO80512.1 hypothetical protein DSCO28_10780 [Desulfosarcina ovata subsp. sediminis]